MHAGSYGPRIEEGAAIHGASAVTAVVRDGAGWSIRTGRASVGCEFVVLATNGYKRLNAD